MGRCDGCGAEVSDDELYKCGECGKKYCEQCAIADGVIKRLGVCSDCEEVYEAEEDYWGWEAIKNTAVPLGYKDAYGPEKGFCLEGHGRIDAWVAYDYQAETPTDYASTGKEDNSSR